MSPKRPTDIAQRAKMIVDLAVGLISEKDNRDPKKVAAGRAGGVKGGKSRAANMTTEQRKKAASKAAKTRWNKV